MTLPRNFEQRARECENSRSGARVFRAGVFREAVFLSLKERGEPMDVPRGSQREGDGDIAVD